MNPFPFVSSPLGFAINPSPWSPPTDEEDLARRQQGWQALLQTQDPVARAGLMNLFVTMAGGVPEGAKANQVFAQGLGGMYNAQMQASTYQNEMNRQAALMNMQGEQQALQREQFGFEKDVQWPQRVKEGNATIGYNTGQLDLARDQFGQRKYEFEEAKGQKAREDAMQGLSGAYNASAGGRGGQAKKVDEAKYDKTAADINNSIMNDPGLGELTGDWTDPETTAKAGSTLQRWANTLTSGYAEFGVKPIKVYKNVVDAKGNQVYLPLDAPLAPGSNVTGYQFSFGESTPEDEPIRSVGEAKAKIMDIQGTIARAVSGGQSGEPGGFGQQPNGPFDPDALLENYINIATSGLPDTLKPKNIKQKAVSPRVGDALNLINGELQNYPEYAPYAKLIMVNMGQILAQESGGNPGAVNDKDPGSALGMYQMTGPFRDTWGITPEQAQNPEVSTKVAVNAYLSYAKKFGLTPGETDPVKITRALTLARYAWNAGENGAAAIERGSLKSEYPTHTHQHLAGVLKLIGAQGITPGTEAPGQLSSPSPGPQRPLEPMNVPTQAQIQQMLPPTPIPPPNLGIGQMMNPQAAQVPVQAPQQAIPMANFAPPVQQGMSGMIPPAAMGQSTPQQATGAMTGSKPGMSLEALMVALKSQYPGASDQELLQLAVMTAKKMGIPIQGLQQEGF